MKFTVNLTFDSLEEMQAALDKLTSVNSSTESKQPKSRKKSEPKPEVVEPQEVVTEADARAILIQYANTQVQTQAEIREWMTSRWGSAYLKEIDPKFYPEIKKEVEAKLCSQKPA